MGTAHDSTGAVMPGVSVTVTNKDTGLERKMTTSGEGIFSAASLPAGNYSVKASATGFRTLEASATVQTGQVTNVDMELQLGAEAEVINVQGETAQISYDSHEISGVITHETIENLPVNGRSFLQLSMLEPGVSVTPNNVGQYNKQFDVSILGASSANNSVRITVDGATVQDSITGGTQQNFSQEVVQEFQLSSTNFDLSTGIGAGGAINVVTRSGGNDFHGSAFFFYRDHNMSAFPSWRTSRASLPVLTSPASRRASGSGAHQERQAVFLYQPGAYRPDRPVSAPSPAIRCSRRWEPTPPARITPTNSPSGWTGASMPEQRLSPLFARRQQFLCAARHWRPAVGLGHEQELGRFRGLFADQRDHAGHRERVPLFVHLLVQCQRATHAVAVSRPLQRMGLSQYVAGDVNADGPMITVLGVNNFALGESATTPQSRLLRRHIFADNVSSQKGTHSIKFGGYWEYQKGTGLCLRPARRNGTVVAGIGAGLQSKTCQPRDSAPIRSRFLPRSIPWRTC
jgi:hypothetical protein